VFRVLILVLGQRKKHLSIAADQEQFYLVRFFFCYMHFHKHNLPPFIEKDSIYLYQ